MSIDIGKLIATMWEQVKSRFWLLLGMTLAFYAIFAVVFMIFGGAIGGSLMGMMGAVSEMDAGLGAGIGVGMILSIIVFYFVFLVLMLVMQASLTILASPLESASFGEALTRGFNTAIPFLLLILVYFGVAIVGSIAVGIVVGIIGLILSFLGDVGTALMFVVMLGFYVVLAWVGLRLSMIVPMIAVDGERSPISALKRTWELTRGHALSILVAYVLFTLFTIALIIVPFLMIGGMGAMAGAATGDPLAAMGAATSGLLLFALVYVLLIIVGAVMIACIHAAISDTPTSELQDAFE